MVACLLPITTKRMSSISGKTLNLLMTHEPDFEAQLLLHTAAGVTPPPGHFLRRQRGCLRELRGVDDLPMFYRRNRSRRLTDAGPDWTQAGMAQHPKGSAIAAQRGDDHGRHPGRASHRDHL